MDDIRDEDKVFIIGATNRPDLIDTSLMRPGRFDRLICISAPDLMSRSSILKAALRKTSLSLLKQTISLELI